MQLSALDISWKHSTKENANLITLSIYDHSNKKVRPILLELTSHDILFYMWPADLSKRLLQLIISIYIVSQYLFQ